MVSEQNNDCGKFGRRLRTARKSAGLTLQAVADALNREFGSNVNKGTISKYENGIHEPSAPMTYCLAQLLGISQDYLLGKPVGDSTPTPTTRMTTGSVFQYIVKDSSMAPRYLPNDILLIQTSQGNLNGHFCLVEIPECGRIIRQVILTRDGWHLQSLNPEYATRFMPFTWPETAERSRATRIAHAVEHTEPNRTPVELPDDLKVHGVVVELRRRELPPFNYPAIEPDDISDLDQPC